MKQLIIAIRVTILFTLITGLAYPLVVTGLTRVLFPHQAAGSLILAQGKPVGSSLIGQKFTRPEYFHGRPDGYDGLASGGPNLGPTSQKLVDRVRDDVKKFRAENPQATEPLPADLLTASGSSLDPQISPAAADVQVARVASARSLSPERLRELVAAHTEGRTFGVLGEPRVNVLELNLALDQTAPLHK
jgi:K+-transporting ATPase ATPase C chain